MKKRQGWKILLVIAGITILIIGGAFTYTYIKTQNIINGSFQAADNKELRNPNKQIAKQKPLSVLLLGTDTGEFNRTDRGRTDTMIVATVNPKAEKTLLVSIPRDTRTRIDGFPNVGYAKINAAYAYGSAGTAMNTVQKLIDNPIDYYVLINMGGLEKMVNQVGGVDVKSPLTFDFAGYKFEKGKEYHMNGKKALEFSRMRHEDPRGDYGRQERQRLVIMALINELKKPKNLANSKLLEQLGKNIKTDLKFDQLRDLGLNYQGAAKSVVSDHLQGESQMINGQSFEVVMPNEKERIADEIKTALK